jgi:hypothetical protein
VKAYSWFFVIALVLIFAAVLIDRLTEEDPRHLDQQVSEILEKLSHQPDQEQRRLLVDELLSSRKEDFNHQWPEHLAEALFLAGIMIFTVEGVTKYIASKEVWESSNELSQEIKDQADRIVQNVWAAIFQRLLPPPLAAEVEKILKGDVCRIRPEYTVTLTKGGYTDVPEGFIVVRRQLYYRLKNLSGKELTTTIPLHLFDPLGDRKVTKQDGSTVLLPRICELKVSRTSVPISDAERTSLVHQIKLPKMDEDSDAVEIYSEVESLSLLNDRALYSQTAPCYDLELCVVNQIPDLVRVQENNVYLSSGEKRLYQKTPDRWACEGGLLTGTALSLSWAAVPAAVVPVAAVPAAVSPLCQQTASFVSSEASAPQVPKEA